MNLKVKIDKDLDQTLEDMALEQSTTAEEFASNILEGYLFSEYKKRVTAVINIQSLDSVKALDKAIKDTIVARRPKVDNSGKTEPMTGGV